EEPVRLKSFAKVNLYLRVTGIVPNGYHSLYSVFQEITFHDVLTFTQASKFSISCSRDDLPCNDSNLCFKAYKVMQKYAPMGNNYSIYLEKNIPMGAGLGGGSSNAAAVLKFLNKAWDINFSERELIDIAKEICADAPFFIRGKTQIAKGIGDLLEPIQLPEKFVLLLVCPDIHVSTTWAYRELDLTIKDETCKFSVLFDDKRIFWDLFENQFETVVFPAYPEVGRVKKRLIDEGAQYAGLSGSGSTVFGVFKERKEAIKANKCFDAFKTFITLPIFWDKEKQNSGIVQR
ncbi:MAG: 4-(cytidine 5'-diphospho)-2-C-methyl-D-erythritol kinase, partial [Candidatus Neomarinimicrobiota bacterium]